MIKLVGENHHKCGYCKSDSEDASISFGFISQRLHVFEYEKLMLIGWRRSGIYFYKPLNHATCCPMYSIRLSVNDFEISRQQKKVLKAVQKLTVNIPPSASNADSPIVMVMEPPCFTEEKFALYRKYQTVVHNEDPELVNSASFTSFLVDSPLYSDQSHPELNRQYGTYHQLYRLNGNLVAVGVLDLLLSGLSSVYLFYDPDYRHLVLGKYAALKEIGFCRTYNFPFYYMGYYIHSCEKMRYKGDYHPSQLLCPLTLSWVPLRDSVPMLENHKFTPLVEPFVSERAAISEENSSVLSRFVGPFPDEQRLVNGLTLNLRSMRIKVKFSQLTAKGQTFLRPLLQQWVKCAGEEMSQLLELGLD